MFNLRNIKMNKVVSNRSLTETSVLPETHIEIIDRLLLAKTGKRACEHEYMEVPEEDRRYNARLSIGNIHLVAGRIKTKSKADQLVDKFLKTNMP